MSLAALLLVASARGARAEDPIYRWVDEKGQIHFTATPPPRNARAVESKPGEKAPVQVVPMPGSARPASAKPSSIAPPLLRPAPSRSAESASAAAPAPERVECGRFASELERARRAQQAVSGLERSIERLENDPVASTRTSCTDESERRGDCRSGSYNRDRELEKAREKLRGAEDELADAEGKVRAAGVPRECLDKE